MQHFGHKRHKRHKRHGARTEEDVQLLSIPDAGPQGTTFSNCPASPQHTENTVPWRQVSPDCASQAARFSYLHPRPTPWRARRREIIPRTGLEKRAETIRTWFRRAGNKKPLRFPWSCSRSGSSLPLLLLLLHRQHQGCGAPLTR